MSRLGRNLQVVREGDGEPLVLLHCLGVDHRFWDFAAPLAGQFSTLRYDLPGHGSTPLPNFAYDIQDLADQLADVLHDQKIDRAHIAGISLGGLIAQDFAARYPNMVSRLILIDTTPRYTDEMRAMWAERAATARKSGVNAMVGALLNIWFSADAIAANLPGVKYVRETLERCEGESYALACEALAAADLRQQVGAIKADTLVICGDHDIPSFLDAANWLASHIPSAKLAWIAGARHASVLEKPDNALSLMTAFLKPEIE